ncbi:hypothetical protein LTR04_001439 [Oleoguttula sp. CCFEE 6159]|nr:hypothetical protein LTR04_001439 [Oleoguttula sp. CCFEE 6159]
MHIPPLDVVAFPFATMSTGFSIRSCSSAPPYSPHFATIQKSLKDFLYTSTISVCHVEAQPGYLHRVHLLSMSDGSRLVLKCPSPYTRRLLRQEQHSLENESLVLELLRSSTSLPVARQINFDRKGGSFGTSYLLSSFVQGTSMADLFKCLSSSDRAGIDRSLGSYVKDISSITATAFGLPHKVAAGTGSRSWREAYRSMLEGVLRDAEDALVSLPYDSIRYFTTSQSHLLDEIKEPSLVVLDLASERNVLVDERTKQISGLLGCANAVW